MRNPWYLPIDWFALRPQFAMVEPLDVAGGELRVGDSVLVHCHCPRCKWLLGEWREGGSVPLDIWHGVVVCPRCGWQPDLSSVAFPALI